MYRRWWAWCLHVLLQCFEKSHWELLAGQLASKTIHCLPAASQSYCQAQSLWHAGNAGGMLYHLWMVVVQCLFPNYVFVFSYRTTAAVWLAVVLSWLTVFAVRLRFCQCTQKPVVCLGFFYWQIISMVEIKLENDKCQLCCFRSLCSCLLEISVC